MCSFGDFPTPSPIVNNLVSLQMSPNNGFGGGLCRLALVVVSGTYYNAGDWRPEPAPLTRTPGQLHLARGWLSALLARAPLLNPCQLFNQTRFRRKHGPLTLAPLLFSHPVRPSYPDQLRCTTKVVCLYVAYLGISRACQGKLNVQSIYLIVIVLNTKRRKLRKYSIIFLLQRS